MDAMDAHSDAMVRAIEKIGPAVVQIEVDAAGKSGPASRPRPPRRNGLGSGLLISPEGHLITNAHVVGRGTRRTRVGLHDGRSFTGRVIGKDTRNDLALVKILASDLPSVALSETPELRVGQRVVAIGNPHGLRWTATVGVISAVGRTIDAGNGWVLRDLIQTDASINPGNSGGPLVDAAGTVIGITTAALQGAQGIGFAVPIRPVVELVEDVIVRGNTEQVWLGVGGYPTRIDPAVAARYDIPHKIGILILGIAPDSPAERCGVKFLDLLCTFDGEPVGSTAELQRMVRRKKPGQGVVLTLLRGNVLQKRTANLETVPGI